MSDIDYEKYPYGVEAHGPFVDFFRLTVHGYEVPYITAHELKQGDEQWDLMLDGRFAISATDMEMRKWMPFLANAMAVAAGYSCFGENCRPLNPFTKGVMRVTSFETGGETGYGQGDDHSCPAE